MGDYTYRGIEGVSVEPVDSWALPDLPLSEVPITTDFDGPWGTPYVDGLEDPATPTGLLAPSPNPSYPQEDVGWAMPPGAYRGEYRTLGPVQAWGLEPSGGWNGDQAIGRVMRFPANIPDRYDANGVNVGDYRDSLAQSMAANKVPMFTDTVDGIEDLVSWQGAPGFGGWDG